MGIETGSLAALSVFVALNLLAASSGAVFRPGAWYRSLAKPRWCPPDWLFGPAWAVLYTTIAVAGWLVWLRAGLGWPILVYLVSLGFNAGWSAIFFGLRRMDWAFAWILAFWASVLAMIVLFWPVSPAAALLLLPYFLWVGFASALNWTIWQMNRAAPAPAG